MAIRPRRSVLYMPGSNARTIEKARTLPVDAVILDLEDSVAPDGKTAARKQVADAVAAGVAEELVNGAPPKGAGADDLLDALACLAMSRRIHAGLARPFPDPPARDAFGLPMAIWA